MLLKLALRNIGRNKRRTVITITAVAFATLVSIGMRGLQLGTYKVNIENAVSLFTGYMQVQRAGFLKNPSLAKSFSFTDEIEEIVSHNTHIMGYAPRVYADGLAAFGEKSVGVMLFGISPAMEKKVSKLSERLKRGRFISSDSTLEVVVGERLLKNLDAAVGNDIVILAQAFDGTLGNMRFRIVGTFETGMKDLDRTEVIMGLKTAQDLLSMYGRVNVVALSVTDPDRLESTKEELETQLGRYGLVCPDWKEILPELKQSIDFDNIGGILTLAILVVVVAFGILNTVLMSVTERFREFGVLLAIGMPNRKLARVVLMEGILIALIGIIIGNIGAVGVNYYFSKNPIVATGEAKGIYEQYGFLPVLQSTLDPGIFLRVTTVILAIAIMSIIYPVVKVSHLEPLKGIRHT